MTTMDIPRFEQVLNMKPKSPDTLSRYFKLCISYVEFIEPNEIKLETGRLIQLLSKHPQGLKRDEILNLFYPDYANASFNRKNSLKICLEKIIQRSRVNFKKYNMTIVFCKDFKRYYLKLI